MGKLHLIAAVIIVLATSLFAPGDRPGDPLASIAPMAGGQALPYERDADAPLILDK